VFAALRRSFDRWLRSLDPAVRAANHDPRGWVVTTLAALAVSGIAAFAPGVRDYFGLSFAASVACLVPGVAFGLATNAWDERIGYSRAGYGTVVLLGSALLQFYASSLVTLSHAPGAFVMGAMPILVASYHGLLYRSAPQTPFVAIASAVGMAGAYALAPSDAALGVFALAGPAAITGSLLLGLLTARDDRERVREASLRSAIQAQILETRSGELRRLSAALLGILERNHDASNALSTSLLSANFLVDVTKTEPLDERERDEAHEVAVQLRAALARLKGLVDDTRRLGKSEIAPTEELAIHPVVALPVARRVIAEIADRFPKARIACHAAGERAAAIPAEICGGEATLHRVLENVLLNACQGDGTQVAQRVDVYVRDEPNVGALVVQVIDDGPGFTDAQLARPIGAFETSKPDGTGLGLYTAERLVRASGGSLQRANGLDGGAVVTLFFAEAKPG
jgi:two-component system C4-dicarboxylate transport sensor histidine kinase DctB